MTVQSTSISRPDSNERTLFASMRRILLATNRQQWMLRRVDKWIDNQGHMFINLSSLLLFLSMIRWFKCCSCLLKFTILIFSFFSNVFSDCSMIFFTYSFEQILNRFISSFIFDLTASLGESNNLNFYGELLSIRVSVVGSANSFVIFLWKCWAFLGSKCT